MFPLRKDRPTQEISKSGNIYYLINAFLGAYNRRTDVLSGQSGDGDASNAIDQLIVEVKALRAQVDLLQELIEGGAQQQIDQAAQQLRASSDTVEDAINQDQQKETK